MFFEGRESFEPVQEQHRDLSEISRNALACASPTEPDASAFRLINTILFFVPLSQGQYFLPQSGEFVERPLRRPFAAAHSGGVVEESQVPIRVAVFSSFHILTHPPLILQFVRGDAASFTFFVPGVDFRIKQAAVTSGT